MNELKTLIKQFIPFAQEKMGFDHPPKLFLRQDSQNAADPLGKTGFYDPEAESITLYVTNRHPKDILRSLSHELMHHTQKCRGDFENTDELGEQGYAQNNNHLRFMEIEAYQASIVFRDWEDSIKETIYYESLQKGEKTSMSTKDWKHKELSNLLAEAWGFDFKLLNEEKSALRDGCEHDEDKPGRQYALEEDEEGPVEEGGAADRPESKGKGVDQPDRGKRMSEAQLRQLVRAQLKKLLEMKNKRANK